MTGQNFKVAHEGSLLPYLFELFPGQSKTGVKNLLSKGQVLVNGESQTAFDLPLKKGDRITVLPKGISIARATRSDARDQVIKAGVQILFEDDNYIVVDKPSGMLSVATGKERKTLYSLLNAYIKVNARMQRKEDLISGRQPDRSNAKSGLCTAWTRVLPGPWSSPRTSAPRTSSRASGKTWWPKENM